MRVVIAGGGVGGPATALSLHAAGFEDVVVCEAAEAIRPLGVGINLLPHAVRELTELGLADRLAEIGMATGERAGPVAGHDVRVPDGRPRPAAVLDVRYDAHTLT